MYHAHQGTMMTRKTRKEGLPGSEAGAHHVLLGVQKVQEVQKVPKARNPKNRGKNQGKRRRKSRP